MRDLLASLGRKWSIFKLLWVQMKSGTLLRRQEMQDDEGSSRKRVKRQRFVKNTYIVLLQKQSTNRLRWETRRFASTIQYLVQKEISSSLCRDLRCLHVLFHFTAFKLFWRLHFYFAFRWKKGNHACLQQKYLLFFFRLHIRNRLTRTEKVEKHSCLSKYSLLLI